jgi:hypothetical protein
MSQILKIFFNLAELAGLNVFLSQNLRHMMQLQFDVAVA